MEHNDKFHHWRQGKDAGVAAQLEDPKLFWCRAEGTGRGGNLDRLAMRQVWDGGEIVANINLEDSVKQVTHNLDLPPPPSTWRTPSIRRLMFWNPPPLPNTRSPCALAEELNANHP